MSFTHFKNFTAYSLTKGLIDIKPLIKKAKELGFESIAISDINNNINTVDFYKEAINNGIKPILGTTVLYKENLEDENKYELSFYVKNKEGYANLNKLLTKIYEEADKADNAFILKEWFNELNLNGLICFSGGIRGNIGQHIINNDLEKARKELIFLKEKFKDNFFIELQRDGSKDENVYMEGAVKLANEENVAPVATNPTFFLEKEDYLTHELKSCITSQEQLYSLEREIKFNKEMYLKSEQEMKELFSDIPVAIDNANKISDLCNFQLQLGINYLPKYPTEENITEIQELRKQANEGLVERLIKLYPEETLRNEKKQEYQDRLNMELDVIEKMGFAGYFLVVSDFIKYSKKNDIPVGPGRGSGAGSLVAYSTKITDLDPLKYNLLFERFLNPERVSMPDFDIDFCQEKRGLVIDYVRNKYGIDKVAQIGTVGTLAARAAVKDVTKILGYPYALGDKISKMIKIPPAKAHEINLKTFLFGDEEKGIPADEKLLYAYQNDTDIKKIIDFALKIEGLPRQTGVHAGGVLISPEPITNFTSLYKKDKDSDFNSQLDKNGVEEVGLVKFDFLGLGNLTIINNTIKDINKEKKENGEDLLDINDIETNDPAIYSEIFAKGNTSGIFQFESNGMKSIFRQAQPDKFEDLIALNALYRPGPMDIIPEWIQNRKTPIDQIEYPHPLLKDLLAETYGFMVYQEQVMQAAQIIAGYSLGGADILRRAMGKKKPEEMAKQREVFIKGAAKNNIPEEKANEIFDTIEKFSGYGFNKSHAAAYSLIAYQTAYLKYYHTNYYIKAQLNSDINNTDGLAKIVKDAKINGLNILPPDINLSFKKFEVEGNNNIRYALTALKGVGEDVADYIISTRQKDGPFIDIYDFIERMPERSINKRALEPMIKAGVFDSIYPNRKQLFDNLSNLLNYFKKFNEKKEKEKDSQLIDIPLYRKEKGLRVKKKIELNRPEFKDLKDWDNKQRLINEKDSFGYYFSADPSLEYIKALDGFKAGSTPKELEEDYKNDLGNSATIYGVISDIIPYKSKTGANVFITVAGEIYPIMVKNDILNKNPDLFKPDNFIAINVKCFESDDETIKFSANNAFSFDDCFAMTANKLYVGSEDKPENIEKFEEICAKYPGKKPISLYVENAPGQRKDKLVSTNKIEYSSKIINEFKQFFGEDWIKAKFGDYLDFKQNNYNNYKNNYKKKI